MKAGVSSEEGELLLLLLQVLLLVAKGEAESLPPQPEGHGSKSINCIL